MPYYGVLNIDLFLQVFDLGLRLFKFQGELRLGHLQMLNRLRQFSHLVALIILGYLNVIDLLCEVLILQIFLS